MAAGAYSNGVEHILTTSFDTDTDTTKMMLTKSAYTYDPDHDFVNDISGSEADCTNYTGGFNGSGRKTATVTVTEQTASNRVVHIFNDLTWTTLGGASNNTLSSAVWIREITNDAASIPLAYLEFSSNLTTNGGDVSVDFDGTNGNVRWSV